MAYVSKELKAEVAAKLKTIMPKDWKYSLAVRHYSELVLTISKAPVDLTTIVPHVNVYYIERCVLDKRYVPLFTEIVAALNTDNYNNSNAMIDYFDVGHYVSINIGKYDKPFVCTATPTTV